MVTMNPTDLTGNYRGSGFMGIGTGSNSRSFDIESWTFVAHKDYQLQILQKKPFESSRRKVPATTRQRLSYYRSYFNAPYKIESIQLNYIHFIHYFWHYALNTVCKTLPTAYIHYFLSDYVPEDHMFLPRMVPFAYGCNWLILLAAFFELILSSALLSLYLDYVVRGFIYSCPWNRCISSRKLNLTCYNMNHFLNLVRVKENKFIMGFYTMPNGTRFQPPPIFYFANRQYLNQIPMIWNRVTELSIYPHIVWLLAALCARRIMYQRSFWKVLDVVQMMTTAIYIVVLFHCTLMSVKSHVPVLISTRMQKYLEDIDLHLIAESPSSPPVIHFLTARSEREISPAQDSAVMVGSNFLFFILKAFTFAKTKNFVEGTYKSHFVQTNLFANAWFYIWPLYFYDVTYGDILTLVVFTVTCILEMMTFLVTYQIFEEMMVSEWRIKRYWLVNLILFSLSVVINIAIDYKTKLQVYMILKVWTTLYEICIVVYFYPLARFMDDISFCYGSPPSRALVYLLLAAPIYYIYKMYHLLKEFLRPTGKSLLLSYFITYFPLAPFVVGIFYALILFMLKKKQTWRVLFRPLPQWGPREHVIRQLRKQFDSREFIYSQASRYLSRHMMVKNEGKMYKLDVNYDKGGRRSTIMQDTLKLASEITPKS